MFQDRLTLKGRVHIEMQREHGLVEVYDFNNLVVTVGKEFVAARMVGNTPEVMSHMAIGTSNVAPTVSDTTLGTETARVPLNSAGAVGVVASYSATFGAGIGTGAVVEAGIFNAAALGMMLSRVIFPVVNKGAADAMSITWSITVQ